MIPNPIRKVLLTLSIHEVRYLLMGGQACVFYGAAEFSRDCDIVILCESQNLLRLENALRELAAERIAVPPFAVEYLERGHAVHFRCQAGDVAGMRVDVMSKMRGVASFEELWGRRTTLEGDDGEQINLMSLDDLVAAKKTQRDKDWPMIRRLVESHYLRNKEDATLERLAFWFKNARTTSILIELAAKYPGDVDGFVASRPLLSHALTEDEPQLEVELAAEEMREREADRLYWMPLRAELEELRWKRM